jgi:hypothetical protein
MMGMPPETGPAARAALADVLLADHPRPELETHLAVFAPLIGSWQLQVSNYEPGGSRSETDAEWTFCWALDGRAMIDVWISPSRGRRTDPAGEWGMSVRFWDDEAAAFRSTWHGPARGWVVPFLARESAGGLVLETLPGQPWRRWVFSGLTAEAFRWRAEERGPDGQAFVRQRFRARRRPPGTVA